MFTVSGPLGFLVAYSWLKIGSIQDLGLGLRPKGVTGL